MDAPLPLDIEAIRRDFPIFERDFGGRRLAYLDSAATALKPRPVVEAVDDYHRRYSANVHRGIYAIGQEATAAYEGARARVARFIGAGDAREVVFVRNATEAINLVAYAWGRRNIGRGDLIVLTELEHHSNLVPWQLLAQEMGAELEFVPFDDDGRLVMAAWERLLEARPRLAAFTHKSNGLGTRSAVERMVRDAHDAGATVLIDGAQAVPHLPVDVGEIGADFYAFSGHKVLAPPGSGALWARRELLEAMPPFMSGGEMISSVGLRHTTFNEVPHKFEAGTPDVAAAIGLGAAVEYIDAIGMERLAAHEQALTAYALEMLPQAVPGIRIHGPHDAAARAGIVTFTLPEAHPHDIATLLDREAVAIRAGHHCTQPLHERLGLAATARASFSVYSGRDDIDRLADGLRRVQRIFGAGRVATLVAAHEAPAGASARAALPSAPLRSGGAS
jgi:cysteine desulfurase/selenocysteine lyase